VLGTLGAVWVALAVGIALVQRKPWVVPLTVCAVAAADLLTLGLKYSFGRERPFIADPEQAPLVSTPLGLSFPSGHSATSFAGATVIAAYAPALALPAYALAALVAVSRVYVGVHYPLDIVGGALLGTAVGLLVLAFAGQRRLPWLRRREVRSLRWPGAGPRR
jgi:undecaprenyl-diphosphatase